jgi:quercetin 2,3-dioxygenase
MNSIRHIRHVSRSRPTMEGAGVHLNRAFGNAQGPPLDPFLLLDDFRSGEPADYIRGFPWHPHRGMETITYVLDGSVAHGDSMGNEDVIRPGDVQWMTPGSGIIHQEMPEGDATGRMGGFQLWANLPAADKMMDPRYRGVKREDIPEVTTADGTRIRVIAGDVGGVRGPVRDVVIDPEYLDVTLPPSTRYVHPTRPGHTVFAYVIDGRAEFCEQADPFAYDVDGANYFDTERTAELGNGSLVVFGDGEAIAARTGTSPVRFLLVAGKPLGEPVAWYGPIVMNTRQELQVAFDELNRGTFIKHRGA